ncbi:uncharacterized protein DDB_G0292642-like [Branchiostoma floridae]|uniref:Uncharacterized protein DDB_G0292642-like n=1 Tax=Branchiostoma floridae TaxID=7739 RepID=A0A9J7M0I8_BRAFL|nr:uncharacterized protein DDB_G0292642-like [Branchiostoma floridae]
MGRMWQLFVKGINGKSILVDIHQDATVDELIDKISEKNKIPPTTQRVIFAGKQLEYGQGKHLTDYKIQNNSTLFVVLRLRGGSGTSPPPKQLDDDVETTEAPDMISWEDDPSIPRAKMSCGHAITPGSLTTYGESLLSEGKYVFKCPYVSPSGKRCRKEWHYSEVRRIAVLTEDEKKQFETQISDNYLLKGMGIQECPKCRSYCERSNKDKRVVCPFCSASDGVEYHFCWHCLRKWVGGGAEQCGNDDCSGEDPRLKILRDCEKKTIVKVVGCPSIRACLKCGMLIEHEEACKHMTCTTYSQMFCFICLKPAQNGSYQCGSYNSPCKIADVQKTIPGDN